MMHCSESPNTLTENSCQSSQPTHRREAPQDGESADVNRYAERCVWASWFVRSREVFPKHHDAVIKNDGTLTWQQQQPSTTFAAFEHHGL